MPKSCKFEYLIVDSFLIFMMYIFQDTGYFMIPYIMVKEGCLECNWPNIMFISFRSRSKLWLLFKNLLAHRIKKQMKSKFNITFYTHVISIFNYIKVLKQKSFSFFYLQIHICFSTIHDAFLNKSGLPTAIMNTTCNSISLSQMACSGGRS